MTRLPFAPFPGLHLAWKPRPEPADGPDECWVYIDSVEWDQSLSLFVCECHIGGPVTWCNCLPADNCCSLAGLITIHAFPESGFVIREESYELFKHDIGDFDRGEGWPPPYTYKPAEEEIAT